MYSDIHYSLDCVVDSKEDSSQVMKLAFVHTPKCAGTFARVYLTHTFYLNKSDEFYDDHSGWRVYDNHTELCEQDFKLKDKRDYKPEELSKILEYEKGRGGNAFVHNHINNWYDGFGSEAKATPFYNFRNAGWKTFSFVRPYGEILCSYYFYLKNYENYTPDGYSHSSMCISDQWNLTLWGIPRSVILKITLDEFISIALLRNNSKTYPPFWNDIDFICEYSNDNFSFFLKKYLNIDFSGKIPNVDGYRDSKKEKLLTSENKGYSHYCETGEISKLNQEKIKNHFKTEIYKKIVEKSKRLLSV